MTAPTPISGDVYAILAGPIDQDMAKRAAESVAVATQRQVTHLHLLLQSAGGFVGDGVFLYSLFRSLPFDLTIYNGGAIQSIATIAFLGTDKRKASTHASFLIHRTATGGQPTKAASLKAITHSLTVDDERTEAILRKHLLLTEEDWNALDHHDLTFSATEALERKIITEIGDFSPPKGVQIFNI